MYPIIKRSFDIATSLLVLLILSPFLLIIAALIIVDSKGGAFYKQERIGRNRKPFLLYKFRSMRPEADKGTKITIGNDPRITKIGAFIRKYKIDELPQLINIISGDMSVVGPRPEVKQYVDLYNEEQCKVFSVKPGLTDYASIVYFNEQEELGKSNDPERLYIGTIMPQKLKLNLKYIGEQSFIVDLKIVIKTFAKIIK